MFEFVLGSVFVFVILKGKIKNFKFLCLCLGFGGYSGPIEEYDFWVFVFGFLI